MAIRSLKTGQFSRSALVGNPVIMPGSYESIATVTVGSGGTGSITFSSIPQTFTHLQIRGIGRSSAAATSTTTYALRFNSDTGSNYSQHYLYGTGAAVSAGGSASQTSAQLNVIPNNSQTSGVFGVLVTDILDYTNTNKYKTIRSIGGVNNNNTSEEEIWFQSALWQSTSAVSSITIFISGANFTQYSQFALYGVN
jgi:hypothetical protein